MFAKIILMYKIYHIIIYYISFQLFKKYHKCHIFLKRIKVRYFIACHILTFKMETHP